MLAAKAGPDKGSVDHLLTRKICLERNIPANLGAAHGLCTIFSDAASVRSNNPDIQSSGLVLTERCCQNISRTKARSASDETQNLWLRSRVGKTNKIKQAIADRIVSFGAFAIRAKPRMTTLRVEHIGTARLTDLSVVSVLCPKPKSNGGGEFMRISVIRAVVQ